MCGIVAQLVDAPICSLGGLGSNPVEACIFQASSCEFSDLLTPKNYQHVIPPYNITDESNIKAMRLRGNDHPSERLLIVEEILLVSTVGIVSKTVERICPPILGYKELIAAHIQGSFSLLVIITIISFVVTVTRVFTIKTKNFTCHLPICKCCPAISCAKVCLVRWIADHKVVDPVCNAGRAWFVTGTESPPQNNVGNPTAGTWRFVLF